MLGIFEADQDIDLVDEIGCEISGPDQSSELIWFLRESLWNAYDGTDQVHLAGRSMNDFVILDMMGGIDAVTIRVRLDAGVGQRVFDKYRALENDEECFFGGKYRLCVLAALMMRVGANINKNDIDHLREIVADIPSREGYHWPLCDDGFRGPGKRQFLAALNNYKPGTPRDFKGPSCHACGKTKDDVGKALLKCSRCDIEKAAAWFCNKECQKAYWPTHKKSCKSRSNGLFKSLNV